VQSITKSPKRQSPTCVNLFGRRYKVVYEESYYADRGIGARLPNPWLLIVPCRYGHVYPHGGTMLAASVDGHPKLAGVLRRLPCCQVYQDDDDGMTLLFDVADFPQVAQIMRPRLRRQYTPEQRAAMVQRLQPTQYQPIHGQLAARQCVPMLLADPGHLPLQHALFDGRADA
jgi:hypothetical protein